MAKTEIGQRPHADKNEDRAEQGGWHIASTLVSMVGWQKAIGWERWW